MAAVTATDDGGITSRRRTTFVVLTAGAATVAAGALALGASSYQGNLAVSTLLLVVVAAGLDLLVGHAGQVSLATGLFMGVGAYTMAWVGVEQRLPLVASVVVAFATAAAVGIALGPVALRVRGVSFAIVTLGALLVGEYVFEQWGTLTGGNAGRSLTGSASLLDEASLHLPVGTQPRTVVWVWFSGLVAVVSVLGCRKFVRSATGRAMRAVRDHRARRGRGCDRRATHDGRRLRPLEWARRGRRRPLRRFPGIRHAGRVRPPFVVAHAHRCRRRRNGQHLGAGLGSDRRRRPPRRR